MFQATIFALLNLGLKCSLHLAFRAIPFIELPATKLGGTPSVKDVFRGTEVVSEVAGRWCHLGTDVFALSASGHMSMAPLAMSRFETLFGVAISSSTSRRCCTSAQAS